jgi:hypothetical protein
MRTNAILRGDEHTAAASSERHRIHDSTGDVDLIVKMWTGGEAGAADIGEAHPHRNQLPLPDMYSGEMRVSRADPMSVVDFEQETIAGHRSDLHDDAGGGSNDGRSEWRGDVDSVM